jgi:alkaline phosphatase
MNIQQYGSTDYTLKGVIEGSLPLNNSFATVEIDSALNIHIKGFYTCEDCYIIKSNL